MEVDETEEIEIAFGRLGGIKLWRSRKLWKSRMTVISPLSSSK